MDLTSYTTWGPTLMLVMARVGGMFLFAPAFANAVVSVRLRYMLSAVIAVAVLSRLAEPVALPPAAPALVLALGAEMLIGLTIGYLAHLLLVGVELGAAHVAQQMGIALAAALQARSGAAGDPVRRLLRVLAVVVFLAIGGHRKILSGLLGSFEVVPLAGFDVSTAVLARVVAVLAASFVLAVKVAAPVVITLLVVTAVLAVLGRTMPQVGLLSVELPARCFVGLLTLAAALWALGPLIDGATALIATQISQVVRAGA